MQLHFYVSDELGEALKAKADAAGVSLSRFLADLARREIGGDWPERFFEEVIGGWQGSPLVRQDEGDFERRAPLGMRLHDE